jgi:hypothetical protein
MNHPPEHMVNRYPEKEEHFVWDGERYVKDPLLLFRNGFKGDWKRYLDTKLGMDAIMRTDCPNVDETLFDGNRRYVIK